MHVIGNGIFVENFNKQVFLIKRIVGTTTINVQLFIDKKGNFPSAFLENYLKKIKIVTLIDGSKFFISKDFTRGVCAERELRNFSNFRFIFTSR